MTPQKTISDALWTVSKAIYKDEERRLKRASRPVKEAKPQGE